MKASSMIGTSANLNKGDVLSVHDLLYGMMLPSGNDAAYALGEFYGELIFRGSKKSILDKINIDESKICRTKL